MRSSFYWKILSKKFLRVFLSKWIRISTVSMMDGNKDKQLVYFDQSKLKQVILNLVFNSIKFTKFGFIRIETNYDHKKVYIRVKDSGIGIEEDNIPKIFNEFEQEDLTTIKQFKVSWPWFEHRQTHSRSHGGFYHL